MPTLPSGLRVALDASAPFQPTEPLWPIPRGHYWRAAPDPAIPRPYPHDRPLRMGFHSLPAPETAEQALAHCRILTIRSDDQCWWRGEYGHEFPLFDPLDEADRAAWDRFLREDRTRRFLETVADRCRSLALRAMFDAQPLPAPID